MRQLVLDLLPESSPRLDNFVAGSNGEALTGLAAWLAADSHETSLLLWGEAGAGKTHLLRAVDAQYHDASLDADLADVVEPPDTPEAVEAIEPADVAEANGTRRLLAVDNVEALSEAGQIALFNLFNRRRATGGQLLTSASAPPRQLRLREDLRTRLGSGLIYRLHPLSDDEKIAALAAQAQARGLRLPREALDYLLARAPRDMRSLTTILAALDRYSLEHKRAITLPLLREVLSPLHPSLSLDDGPESPHATCPV